MHYTIRQAEIKDAPGVAKVHVETWQSHYRGQVPDDYLDKLSIEKRTKAWTKIFSNPKPKNETFVADEAGKILGFCNVGPSRDTDALHDSGEIHAIYISPDKHSRGMGSALMKAGLKFLKAEGFKTATLWVLKSNTSTIKFYESKGWQADGKEKRDEKDNFYFEEVRYRIYL